VAQAAASVEDFAGEKLIYSNQWFTVLPEEGIKSFATSAGVMAPNLALRQNTRLTHLANFPEGK